MCDFGNQRTLVINSGNSGYKGLPYELKEDSFLPAPAVKILRGKANLTPEQEEYLAAHTLAEAE